jgi:hypothetical protein
MPGQGEDLIPDARVTAAQSLREALENWMGTDQARRTSTVRIWNDLLTADIPDDDPEADEAFKRAGRDMVRNGILSAQELKDLIASVKEQF